MKKIILLVTIFISFCATAQTNITIVPRPVELTSHQGAFHLNHSTVILAPAAATHDATMLNHYLKKFYGFGSTRDSAKYIVTNSQVAISILAQNLNCCSFTNFNPAIKRTYIISNLTANSATLTYSQIINSSSQKQSIATEIINLKK